MGIQVSYQRGIVTPRMNGWWDKPPLVTEDATLRKDLRVSANQQAVSRPAQNHVREQAWSNGINILPGEGRAPNWMGKTTRS